MGMMGGSPFGEDIMTIIMGIDPCEPGMHGPLKEPGPSEDAVALVTKIRDMCDKWLCDAGKCEGQEKPDKPDKPADEPDKEEDDEDAWDAMQKME